MKDFIKEVISGTAIRQEYVCLGLTEFNYPLSVFIVSRTSGIREEITSNHLFLGYKPLVIAIANLKTEILMTPEIILNFCFKDESIGVLHLKQLQVKQLNETKVGIYEGTKGVHHFISPVHQWLNAFLERLRGKPSGNVNLPGNLYDQVRVAYSVPRLISLITVFDGKQMNLFPTDLHGEIDDNFYMGSLRIGGEACHQITRYKRILISEIDVSQYKEAFELGKQHMQPLSDSTHFRLEGTLSSVYGFPIPKEAGLYRELEYVEHFDVGIHRVFVYTIINKVFRKEINPLAHIHRYYAQWRTNHGLVTDYFFR